MTQIMDLLNLAPDIQEGLLCDATTLRADLTEHDVRPIAAEATWRAQRRLGRA